MLAFLHEHRSEGATAAAVDSAALNGHLRIIEWLTANVPALLGTTAAMDGAACAGHLEVVRFLHSHRSEGCTTEAMDSAARRGHVEVGVLAVAAKVGFPPCVVSAFSPTGHVLYTPALFDSWCWAQ